MKQGSTSLQRKEEQLMLYHQHLMRYCNMSRDQQIKQVMSGPCHWSRMPFCHHPLNMAGCGMKASGNHFGWPFLTSQRTVVCLLDVAAILKRDVDPLVKDLTGSLKILKDLLKILKDEDLLKIFEGSLKDPQRSSVAKITCKDPWGHSEDLVRILERS